MDRHRQDGREELKLANENIERVEKFVYMESEMYENGRTEKEVRRRLTLAAAVFNGLWQVLWKRRDMSVKTKLILYNASTIPVASYRAESWTCSKDQEH